MTREEIENEMAQVKQQREIALMNLYRCDGAIAAFELLIQKMDEKDKKEGDTPKESKHGEV